MGNLCKNLILWGILSFALDVKWKFCQILFSIDRWYMQEYSHGYAIINILIAHLCWQEWCLIISGAASFRKSFGTEVEIGVVPLGSVRWAAVHSLADPEKGQRCPVFQPHQLQLVEVDVQTFRAVGVV